MNLLRPAAALVLSALALVAQAAPTPSHVYLLDGTYADQNGGASLVSDGGTLDLTGYNFGVNQGLSLSGVLGTASYTIDFQSSFTDTTGFRRLVDFKDRTSDTGLYNLDRALNFYNITTGAMPVFAPNTLAQVTITRDAASNVFTGYVNGVLQISFVDSAGLAIFDTPTATPIARFFEDDLAVPNEASAGRVEYIRLFDTALSAADVASLAGPSAAVPEPQTCALVLAGLLLGAGVTRARKR